MSDLAKNLLTQYYGLNSESTDKRFLSIHKSVEDAKNEEEKQVTEQTSLSTNEENVAEDESQVVNHFLQFLYASLFMLMQSIKFNSSTYLLPDYLATHNLCVIFSMDLIIT